MHDASEVRVSLFVCVGIVGGTECETAGIFGSLGQFPIYVGQKLHTPILPFTE